MKKYPVHEYPKANAGWAEADRQTAAIRVDLRTGAIDVDEANARQERVAENVRQLMRPGYAEYVTRPDRGPYVSGHIEVQQSVDPGQSDDVHTPVQ